MMEFNTNNYSGPLGLLLHLIEQDELDITEVDLAKIADQYVKKIREVDNLDPEELADFLLIASKLLFIKSKALLPYLYPETEDEDLHELTEQLRMYKEFVKASEGIKAMIAKQRFMFSPPLSKSRREKLNIPKFNESCNVNQDILKEAFINLIDKLEKRGEEKLPEKTLEAKINIEDRIKMIKELLFKKLKFNFSKFIATAKSKTEVVVSFLAILELAKQQELVFEQDELFSEIYIKHKG